MACCDIVVIGASAGGIEPLIGLIRDLPDGFPGAVFVVTHVPPYSVSKLPQILGRAGQLPAAHAGNGDRIEPGRIVSGGPEDGLEPRLLRWLKQHARTILEAETREFAAKAGIDVTRVGVGDPSSRWGSCSTCRSRSRAHSPCSTGSSSTSR